MQFSVALLARFFKWCDGVTETTLLGHILMSLKGAVPFSGICLAAISSISTLFTDSSSGDAAVAVSIWKYWQLPLLNFCGLFISLVPMCSIGAPYDGFVKAMGLPHVLLTAPATVTAVHKLATDQTMTWQDSPVWFVWTATLVAVYGISNAFDVFDTVDWYLLKNRTVLRSNKHIREWQKKGQAARRGWKRAVAHARGACE